MNKEFFDKQLKETIARVIGTINLLNNGKIPIVRDKLQGIKQKLEYILNKNNEETIYSTMDTVVRDEKEEIIVEENKDFANSLTTIITETNEKD